MSRARLYDALALLIAIIIVSLDQWTKTLVVEHLSPPGSKPLIPIIGQYLVVEYAQNNGAAFNFLAGNGSFLLGIFIAIAIIVIGSLYIRILNTGPMYYKLVFGMIIGGALGNLIDRAVRGGYVVDFVSFRIPQIDYYFAIFNVADACISVGVFLLFVLVLLGSFKKSKEGDEEAHSSQPASSASGSGSGTLRAKETDAQP